MHRRSLRLRLTLTFGLGAMLLSIVFVVLTFYGVHHTLISDREHNDLRQAFANGALVRSTLYTSPSALSAELNAIERATSSAVLVQTHHQWLSHSTGANPSNVPMSIVNLVTAGHAVSQIVPIGGQMDFVVGVPIPAVETQFFEVFPLSTLEHTLATLLAILLFGALATSLLGILGGLWVSRRAVRPLEQVSEVATAVAAGDLSVRLPVERADREVQQLTEAFNEMVTRLVDRLEHDARFASDVSHELRSPLTTLATTASVLSQHRDELSAAGRESLDLLVADLRIFQALVEDLLEMARSDAGASHLVIETVPATELVRRSVESATSRLGVEGVPIVAEPGVDDLLVDVDRRRFERVMANLLGNADAYAGGATAVRVARDDGLFVVAVDDAGPGVPPDERDRVFERFFRGRAAHDRSRVHGTGLGLALVRDHLDKIGGTIEVVESPEGGARFAISVPIHEEDR